MLLNELNKTMLVKAKNGKLSIRVIGENSTIKTLHSLFDPEDEARSMVDAFQFDGKGILVVLGLGLGYHVAELSRSYPDARLIVIEPITEIYDITMEYGLFPDKELEIFTGLRSEQVIHKITEIQMHSGFIPVTVFPLSSSVSAFPSYFGPILSSLKNMESVKLWDKLRYRKFGTESLTVLMIDSGYFLLTEAEKAIRSNGHKVVKIRVQKEDHGEKIISGIMEAIINCKPDFLLTINHLGLDEQGIITDFLTSIEMPVASWYVDSPNLIVKAFNKNVSPYMTIFMWDRSYINDMKSMGFENVEYLPLGTDEKMFRPLKSRKHKKKLFKYTCDVSFVGNSMVEPVIKWMSKLNDDIRPIAERLSGNFKRSVNMLHLLKDHEIEKYIQLTEKEKMDLEAAVIWKATLHYRLRCMENLGEFGLRIYGDDEWKRLLDKNDEIYPPVNYYKELPYVFNASTINFNATSLQMKEAVNQRVFDVPACGSFLITDDQKSLHELFEHGKEVITYKSNEEIPELLEFYLNNQSARDKIASKARDRILNEHTYEHRIAKVLNTMRGTFS